MAQATKTLVGEITQLYHCLLNRYNVMNNNILMVTKQFLSHRTPLGPEDFMAALNLFPVSDSSAHDFFENGGLDNHGLIPPPNMLITREHL
ncbi:MAG: ATP adenylyltransferase/5',5'''-P-1,P-4-tetraphosphate phosphorylase II [Porticoccus sp.]|jgi:ATP adenylyltransferase/5',5'''-P-1,P-4-tetraphosphate phosphorylase II